MSRSPSEDKSTEQRLRDVETNVVKILTDVKWQKWLLAALVASQFAPKSVPTLPEVGTSLVRALGI